MDLLHRLLEITQTTVRQVVRLTAVGINRSACITNRLDEVDKLVRIPLEGVEVVIDQNGIWPALVRHLEGLDDPVVARLTTATEGFLDIRGLWLMTIDGLVDNIDHGEIRIMFLGSIHPFHNRLITFLD